MVGNQNVDGPKLLCHSLDNRSHLRRFGDIAGHGQTGQLRGEAVEYCRSFTVIHRDHGSRCRKSTGVFRSHSLGRAGDKNHFSAEIRVRMTVARGHQITAPAFGLRVSPIQKVP